MTTLAPLTPTDVDALLARADELLSGPGALDERLAALCERLRADVPHYDWVGFYLTDPDRPRELVLGPFAGAPTDHVRIPFGRGICGQAAERRETVVIQDVTQESNYLSCSLAVRSEIVVPLLDPADPERVLGELDIDSHAEAPFTAADRDLCEALAARVARLLAGG
jgi:GAF domain-containing protein